MRHNRILLIGVSTLLLLSSSPGAALGDGGEAPQNEAARMELAKQADLHEIAQQLTDPGTARHDGAIYRLIHLASTYPAMLPEVRDLLIRATADPDRRLARLAERALYVFEDRDPLEDAEPDVPEEVLLERAQRRELEGARQALAEVSADSGGRMGEVNTLVHLVSSAPAVAEEAAQLLARVKRDGDFEFASLAERALAAHEDRPVEAALVRLAFESRERPAVDPDG